VCGAGGRAQGYGLSAGTISRGICGCELAGGCILPRILEDGLPGPIDGKINSERRERHGENGVGTGGRGREG
jgi:hypothetical protein